jgi:hypothetical protein
MVEGKEFRELMLQVVRTRMAFRRSMQRTLKKNNAGITFEMLQILSSYGTNKVSPNRSWQRERQRIRLV